MTATTDIIPLELLKQHLRIDHDSEDMLLAAQLDAARRHVEAYVGPLDDFEDGVPADLKEAMKIFVGHLFEHREPTITGTIIAEVPLGFHDLIGPYRTWEF